MQMFGFIPYIDRTTDSGKNDEFNQKFQYIYIVFQYHSPPLTRQTKDMQVSHNQV